MSETRYNEIQEAAVAAVIASDSDWADFESSMRTTFGGNVSEVFVNHVGPTGAVSHRWLVTQGSVKPCKIG